MQPVSFLTAPNLSELPVRHGFFTRQGGVSEGIYASLNCGYGSKDVREAVTENRRRVARALHPDPNVFEVLEDPLATMYQTHSAMVHVVTDSYDPHLPPEADALVTNVPGVLLGVLTADCGPILMADATAGVVAAVHAGWKGAFSGIVENTLREMETLGASRARVVAALGPCIHQESYEVDEGFYRNFIGADARYAMYFVPGNKAAHYQFNLPEFIRGRLLESRVSDVSILPHDTYADEARFFSWRRTCHQGLKEYGRGISVIGM